MKLSEVKTVLADLKEVNFILPNGSFVPKHFHITEVGAIEKNYIDCGGTIRKESVISFQLWEANDFDHRLAPQKLFDIIELSEKELKLQDNPIEVEYQGDTIGKYNLEFESGNFLLVPTFTDCLAKDNCGIPEEQLAKPKQKVRLSSLGQDSNSCCDPKSGCC
ncbi:MAG: hypothetical protein HUJ25_04050 [Crocinitomicaceae bacterium]|nr:hypothetical protein [Crocinitomicaceae bacterium]